MTPIADMVERMFAQGATADLVVLAIRAVETVALRERDASRFVTIPNRSKAAERAARYREKLKQDKANAEANDAAPAESQGVTGERDASRRVVTDAPNFLTSLSSSEELLVEKKVSKKDQSENARARGQRMAAGAILTDEWRQAAIDLGADLSQIPEMWAEHVDYWVGVPGQRGVKTDWLATWRNDVRRKLKMGTYNGHGKPRRQSASDRALELAELARSAERARGIG